MLEQFEVFNSYEFWLQTLTYELWPMNFGLWTWWKLD